MRTPALVVILTLAVAISSAQEPTPQAPASAPAGTPFQFKAGQGIFVEVFEQAAGSQEKPDVRRYARAYNEALKEFSKQGNFRVVGSPRAAELVFMVVHYYKGKAEPGKYCQALALAVKPEDYEANVEWLNPYRGVLNMPALVGASLWLSEKGAKRDIDIFKSPFFLQCVEIKEDKIVKSFHKDVLP